MSFRKPCHMPFRKLIPSFTLTESPQANSTVAYARKFYTRKEALHVWKVVRNLI